MNADPADRRAVSLDGSSGDAGLLGGKGAALDRLIRWDIPVPRCGAATTVAYREVARAPGPSDVIARIRSGEQVRGDIVDRAFQDVAIPDRLAEDILRVARHVGDGASLAVRSSATVEDLAGSSFAGQYRSCLDIDPADERQLLNAVVLVFASLWHPAPCAYREAFGIDDADVAMAAVFMQMVPAVRAGVVFTVDPGGTEGAARVEAVSGLGESLVSGQRTPDAYVLARAGGGPDTPAYAARALELALAIERLDGTPQDVEWAWDGETLWIVQARPITVTADDHDDGFDTPVDDAELTTAGIGEMLPGVLPPLRWQLASHLVNEAFSRLVADLGATTPGDAGTQIVRRVRGRAAMDLDAMRVLADRLPGGSAAELEHQYFGSRRPGRTAAPPLDRPSRWASFGHDLRSMRIQKRSVLDAEVVIEATAASGDPPDLPSMNDSDLAAYQFRLIDLAVRATTAELAVSAAATSSYRKIELVLLPHLGSAAAGHWAEEVTRGRGIFVAPRRTSSAAVFAGPTWAEIGREPPTVSDVARPRESIHAIQGELVETLGRCDSWGRAGVRSVLRTRALRQLVAETVTLLHRREATKAAVLHLGGETRRTILEMGRRLTGSGYLNEPSDIELMSVEEIDAAFRGSPVAPTEIARRRRWRNRYEAEAPLPMVFVGIPEHELPDLPEGGRLEGWAASPGRFTGVASVVADPGDEFEPNAVLVADATDASWSPLFVRAGAIVVERGGPLSHAAILARELGVPAVLNVAGATRLLDGAEVTVDGDAGVVVVRDHRDLPDPSREGTHQ